MLDCGRKNAAHAVPTEQPNLPMANQPHGECSASAHARNGLGKVGRWLLLQLSQPQRECTAHLPPDERGATKQDRARWWDWLDGPLWTPFRTDAAHFLSRSQSIHFISLMARALTSSII